MAYSPKYVSLDEIPVQIPDDYEQFEKEDALEFAEASIELDLYDGNQIPTSGITSMVRAAIKQKATCELAKGAEHPDDMALTDLSDTGSTKSDYAAESFCQRYDEIVDKIISSGMLDDDDATGGESVSPFVYNTSDPSPHDDY